MHTMILRQRLLGRRPPVPATFLLSGFFSALLCVFAPAPANAAELDVRILNIESMDGQLMVAVMASKAAFAGDEAPVLSVILPPKTGLVHFATDALPAGEYAIRVMHDVNGNSSLDSNLIGMPTEPWGMSNDATGNFGPPKWEDARFTLDESATQTIHLNH